MLRVGFWKREETLDTGTFQGQLQSFLEKLENIKDDAPFLTKKSVSKCRFCQEDLFGTEYTWGKFVFPENLTHYVEQHRVSVPKEFYQAVMAH